MVFFNSEIDKESEKDLLREELYLRGFIKFKNLISKNSTNKIKDIMHKYDSSHGNVEKILLRNKNNQLEVLNKSLYNIIIKESSIKKIEKILDNSKDKVHLTRADAYKSQISKNPVLEWHNDKAFSGDKVIHNKVQNKLFSYKLFIHITATQIGNGCLSYVPNSNRISALIRKAFRKGIIEYTPFWNIKDFSEILNKKEIIEFINKYYSNLKDEINEFLETAKKIKHNQNLSDFTIPCMEGDAILFDERGFHQGGVINNSERIVLRLFFLNGAGKYKPEPITELGFRQKDNPVGMFKTM